MSTRRDWLKMTLGAGAFLAGAKALAGAVCLPTPRQTSGPFIPNDFPFRAADEGAPYLTYADANVDLTVVDDLGTMQKPIGQIIYFRGQVVDQDCIPVRGAHVYLWQADNNGHYNHHEDPNISSAAELDPGFQYRGVAVTDSEGRFQFKTIKPKYYPLDESGSVMRTAHLHVTVMHSNTVTLTTQTYFEGDVLEDIQRIRELNAQDIILAPKGKILPELTPLIANFSTEPGFRDGPVGHVTLTVRRR